MGPVIINPKTDILVINDPQKSFLPQGELENPGSGEIIRGILSLLSPFYSDNIHIFYHRHELSMFKNSKMRHSIFYNSIVMAEMLDNEKVMDKRVSDEGVSAGAELEYCIQLCQKRQFEKGFSRSYFKSKCPLLGENFSLIQTIQENNMDPDFLKNGQRIFFCGLNFNPCIENEISYLFKTKQFKEIFIFEDLIRSYNPENHALAVQRLIPTGVKFIKIADLHKTP